MVSVFLEPGSEVRNQKRVKIVPMCEPECYTREVTVFGSAIQVVSSVFLKLGSEVKNKKLVKFGSMCESEAI